MPADLALRKEGCHGKDDFHPFGHTNQTHTAGTGGAGVRGNKVNGFLHRVHVQRLTEKLKTEGLNI